MNLKAEENPEVYTYEMMEEDIEILQKVFHGMVKAESVGETPDGRRVYHLSIGKKGAGRHILINASIHGREYAASWLVMRQAAQFLKDWEKDETMADDVMIHLVPMVNPDGVSISQMGLEGCRRPETRCLVREIMARECRGQEREYLRRWKANGQGIDLNRNFDAMWEAYEDGVGEPSADHYKGIFPGCAPEAAALIALTDSWPMERTISYHAQGSVIYWNFGQKGELRKKTQEFAGIISRITGYGLDGDYSLLDPAGYKDWAIMKKGIPSLTIEIGRETAPVPQEQFERIWQENRGVWNGMLEYSLPQN